MPEIGVLLPFGFDPFDARQLDWLRRLEEVGVESVWARDLPLVDLTDGDEGSGYDPFVYLAVLASWLPEIRLGTAVIGAPFRPPPVAAKAAASLQTLSGGRLLLGMGAGEKPAALAGLGVSWEERNARFAEAYIRVRALLHRSPVDGGPAVPPGTDFRTGPVYAPPPMHVASSNPEVWRAIGGAAEGWMTWFRPLEQLRSDLDTVRSQVRGDLEITMVLNLVLSDEDAALGVTQIRTLSALSVGREALRDLLRLYRREGIDRILVSLLDPRSPVDELRLIVDAASAARASSGLG